MGKEILMFGDIEIEISKFYRHKTSILLKDVDIEKVLVSNKISFGGKDYIHFTGYLYNDNNVKPLHIMLPKTSAHVKRYDGQTNWMYFLIADNDLLEKYNTIWDKVNVNMKKEFDSESAYKQEFLKTKIKSHDDEVTYFYDKKVPKVDSSHTCLAVITLDSTLKKDENYCPQVFLKECKYIEKKVVRHIIGYLSTTL